MLHLGHLRTNCYIVKDTCGKEDCLIVIDPADNAEKIQKKLQEITGTNSPVLTHIVLTHAHFDHIGAVRDLKKHYPDALFCVGANENTEAEYIKSTIRLALGDYYFNKLSLSEKDYSLPEPDIILKDGDSFLNFSILGTPGHTAGSICLYSKKNNVIFTGDTLFKSGSGRTDLGGNEYDMARSIGRLLALPDDTRVLPGHGDETSIGNEKGLYFRIPDRNQL